MADYKSMYAVLFRAVTKAMKILEEAQKETERLYIESEKETPGTVIPFPGGK